MSDNSNTIVGFLAALIFLVGLWLFILWLRKDIRRERALRHSKTQIAARTIAYILGFYFIFTGIVLLVFDVVRMPTGYPPIATYLDGVLNCILGTLIWVATYFRYGGAFWSIIGAFLVEEAFVGTASSVEGYLRGWHHNSPVTVYYTVIVLFWILGGVFLFIGHRRHRKLDKKKQALPNTMPLSDRLFDDYSLVTLQWVALSFVLFLLIGMPFADMLVVCWVKGGNAYFHQGIRILLNHGFHFSDGSKVPLWPHILATLLTIVVFVGVPTLAWLRIVRCYEQRSKTREDHMA